MTAFTGARLDRAGDARRRDPVWVAAQRADPAGRALIGGEGGVALDGERLALVPLAEARGGAGEPLLLGLDGAGPLFALEADDSTRLVGLREAVAILPRDEGGLAAYAAALLNWHRSHRFCATCGAPSDVAEAGLVRACARCGAQHHPRTDPVVIMLVTDGERVLLGRQARWPPRRYSALAGFVEPGESLEEAVAREVEEESGIRIGPPCYVGSQPWPFPSSLMLGFEAPWAGGEPAPQEDEIEDVRWFSRAEVAGAAAHDIDGWGAGAEEAAGGAALLLPPRLAIARQLVERWLRHDAG